MGFQKLNKPVIEGRVALFPLTFRCRLDFSSPPSITSHFTTSLVFDFTTNDIIPPGWRRVGNWDSVTKRFFYQETKIQIWIQRALYSLIFSLEMPPHSKTVTKWFLFFARTIHNWITQSQFCVLQLVNKPRKLNYIIQFQNFTGTVRQDKCLSHSTQRRFLSPLIPKQVPDLSFKDMVCAIPMFQLKK